jgi:hypothetical protein
MKSFQMHLATMFFVFSTPGLPRLGAETPTSTQAPQAINLNSQSCGIDLSLPDFLERNTDDDQDPSDNAHYEKWDLEDIPSPGDNDLKAVTIIGTGGATPGTMTLEITQGPEKINGIFWKDGEKNAKQEELTWQVSPFTSRMETFYIEGYINSASLKDVEIKATMYCPPGLGSDGDYYLGGGPVEVIKQTTVYEVDLDVDSFNDNRLERAGFDDSEDRIEASKKPFLDGSPKPGKYVWVNAGFNPANNDATHGWADGFDSNPNDTEDNVAEVFQFTPLEIKLKKPFDPAIAKIHFIYSACDPVGVSATATQTGGTPDHPYTYTLGGEGHLRIWKKDGLGTRNKASVATSSGHYIPGWISGDQDLDWKQISSTDEFDVAKIYVEAVRAFAVSGGLEITVVVTQDNVVCKDTVKITSVYFKEEENLTIAPSGDVYDFLNAVVSNNVPGKVLMPKLVDPALGRLTVRYESKGNLVPPDADKNLFPMDDMKVGTMQNLISTNRLVSQFSAPALVSWDPTYTAPSVIVPAEYRTTLVIQQSPASRANDNGPGSSFPLLSPDNQLASIGGTSKSTDSVTLQSAKERSIQIPSTGATKVIIKYSLAGMSLEDNFVAWACGQSTSTKQIYPMTQKRWKIKADSSDLVNTGAATVENSAGNLVVPVRSPIANDNFLGNFQVEGAFGGAVTISNPTP